MEKDKYLYKEFLNGNNGAFEELILMYRSNIIYFVTRYVKDIEIAEDIFQDVLIYILENKEKYNSDYSLKTYFYMIAKSRALDYIKHQKYVENANKEEIYQEGQLLEEIIFSKERTKKIQETINKMPLNYQLVIYLTQIEKMSYKDVAKIMEKTEKQIKTLVYNARKNLKKLFIEEKMVEISENKIVKFLLIFVIIITMSSGIIYATIKIYEKITKETVLIPTFTGKIGDTNINRVWCGIFQIGWNEFIDDVIGEKNKIERKNSDLINQLNEKRFTEKMISSEDIYVKVGKTSIRLKNEIINEVNKKFDKNITDTLDKINFEENDNGYTIYTLLYKRFNFLVPFDRLPDKEFNNSIEKVKYFGINNSSEEELNKNVEVLFYKNKEEYSVKILTNDFDEIILYKTNSDDTFDKIYENCIENSKIDLEEKEFKKSDTLQVPYISIDTLINYDELCGYFVEKDKKIYIANALQDIRMDINEKGCGIISESEIKLESFLETAEGRNFDFSSKFVIFIKEREKDYPYLAIRVDNIDILNKTMEE